MGLRIRTNMASLRATRHMAETTSELETSMENLSSGFRINKAADDAAGLAISEKLEAKIRSAGQAKRNANDGVSMIQVAEGSFSEITNILVRLRELAIQASSDTISNQERSFSNKEYTQLVHEIDRIANSTEFNGRHLLKGPEENDDFDDLAIHVGVGNASLPNVDDIKLNIKEIKVDLEEEPSLGTESEVGPKDAEDLADFSRAQAAEKIDKIDTHLRLVATKRAYLGSKQNRLQSTIRNIGVQMENMTSSQSQIRNTDFAYETANLTQLQILQNAGVSTQSQANKWPELVMTLLR